MAYDTEKLLDKALMLIRDNEVVFISDLIALLGIASSTFSVHFPVGSEGHKQITDAIELIRVNTKIAMRKKWKESDNATLQISLYKLISGDDELRRLTQNYNENKNDHKGEVTIVRRIIK